MRTTIIALDRDEVGEYLSRCRAAETTVGARSGRNNMTTCYLTRPKGEHNMPALMSAEKRNMIQITTETRQALEVEQERLLAETGYKHALGRIVDRIVAVWADPQVREAVERAIKSRPTKKSA